MAKDDRPTPGSYLRRPCSLALGARLWGPAARGVLGRRAVASLRRHPIGVFPGLL
jgi:hypothetical protein